MSVPEATTPPVVLVVDDEPLNRELMTALLTPQGYDVRTAADGAQALAMLAGARVDLVLLDVMMPGMSGLDVCRRIRQDPALRGLSVILVTALRTAAEQVEGMEAGANDFVVKPFDRSTLLARVRSALRSKALFDQSEADRRQLAQAKAELEQLEQSRDELMHMLVHDLKSPLTALQLSVSLLEDLGQGADEIGQTTLGTIGDSCSRLQRMVQNILSVRKIEEAGLELQARPFTFELLFDSALAYLGSVARAGGRTLRHAVAPTVRPFIGDFEVIVRILENLVTNALRLSPTGSEVVITVRDEAGGVQVAVSDQGPGVPEAQRSQIFEKFQSAGGSVANHGLGLTFCRLAVEAHGGRIWVEDRPGGGSRFVFTLAPLAAPAGGGDDGSGSTLGAAGSPEKAIASLVRP